MAGGDAMLLVRPRFWILDYWCWERTGKDRNSGYFSCFKFRLRFEIPNCWCWERTLSHFGNTWYPIDCRASQDGDLPGYLLYVNRLGWRILWARRFLQLAIFESRSDKVKTNTFQITYCLSDWRRQVPGLLVLGGDGTSS